MFGIKLFNTYKQMSHILVKPKVRMWQGNVAYAPFLIDKSNPIIKLFNNFEVKLPLFFKFGINNYDFVGKWKFDSARFEWKGVFAVTVFGYTWAFYLDVPTSDDGIDRHEDEYYEFMMEYLNGDNHGDLITCIKNAGKITHHSKEKGEIQYNSLAKSWFRPEWHRAYDIAYERYENGTKNKPEFILCAATKRNEPRKVESNPYWSGTNDILNVELGYRHHDIFRRFNVEDDKEIDTGMYAQGFFTSKGRWVSRSDAAKIAYAAGQIDSPVRLLTSEDLY